MWARWTNVALGIWLILAPWILGYMQYEPRTNDIWLGILVAATALISMAVPGVRWLNVAFGAWLIIAPFVLNYMWNGAIANDVIVGIAVLLLALVPTRRVAMRPAARRPVGT